MLQRLEPGNATHRLAIRSAPLGKPTARKPLRYESVPATIALLPPSTDAVTKLRPAPKGSRAAGFISSSARQIKEPSRPEKATANAGQAATRTSSTPSPSRSAKAADAASVAPLASQRIF